MAAIATMMLSAFLLFSADGYEYVNLADYNNGKSMYWSGPISRELLSSETVLLDNGLLLYSGLADVAFADEYPWVILGFMQKRMALLLVGFERENLNPLAKYLADTLGPGLKLQANDYRLLLWRVGDILIIHGQAGQRGFQLWVYTPLISQQVLNDVLQYLEIKIDGLKIADAPAVDLERAESVIKQYVSEKYFWDEAQYKIKIEALRAKRIKFLIEHQDDFIEPSPRGGKSFVVEFDMQRMEIIKEIRFQ